MLIAFAREPKVGHSPMQTSVTHVLAAATSKAWSSGVTHRLCRLVTGWFCRSLCTTSYSLSQCKKSIFELFLTFPLPGRACLSRHKFRRVSSALSARPNDPDLACIVCVTS